MDISLVFLKLKALLLPLLFFFFCLCLFCSCPILLLLRLSHSLSRLACSRHLFLILPVLPSGALSPGSLVCLLWDSGPSQGQSTIRQYHIITTVPGNTSMQVRSLTLILCICFLRMASGFSSASEWHFNGIFMAHHTHLLAPHQRSHSIADFSEEF